MLFVVWGRAFFRGKFTKPSWNYGNHFHKFQTFYGIMYPFLEIFIVYGIAAKIHSICGIMDLKLFKIYSIRGTDLLGKMERPRQVMGRDIPPPPRVYHLSMKIT